MPVLGTPNIPHLTSKTLDGVFAWANNLVRDLKNILAEYALILNRSMLTDGSSSMTAPLPLAVYTVSTVPAAGDYTGAWIAVSNEAGGFTAAISDGTNWRRMQDRAIIS